MSARRRVSWAKSRVPNPESPPRTAAAGGFTLLEVVVAITLMGLVVATALELLAVGLRSARASADYTQATLLAKRKLAELLLRTPTPQTIEGVSGVYRWTGRVDQEGEESSGSRARIHTLRVHVTWSGRRGDRGVELVTQRADISPEALSAARAAQNLPGAP